MTDEVMKLQKKMLFVMIFWAGLAVAAMLSFVSYVSEREPNLPESTHSLASFDFTDHKNSQIDSEAFGAGVTLINFACLGCRERGVGHDQAVRLANVLSPIAGFRSVTIPLDSDQAWSDALAQRLGKSFGAAESNWHLYAKPAMSDNSIARQLRVEGLASESYVSWMYLVDGSLRVYGPYLAENPDSMIRLQNDAFNILRKFNASKSIARKSQD